MKLSPVSLVAAALAATAGNAIASGPPPPHGDPHHRQGSPHAPQGGPPPLYGDSHHWQGGPHAPQGGSPPPYGDPYYWQGGPAQAVHLQGNPLPAQDPPHWHDRPPSPPWLDNPHLLHESGLFHDPHALSGLHDPHMQGGLHDPHAPSGLLHGPHVQSGLLPHAPPHAGDDEPDEYSNRVRLCEMASRAHAIAARHWDIAAERAVRVYKLDGASDTLKKQCRGRRLHAHNNADTHRKKSKTYAGDATKFRQRRSSTKLWEVERRVENTIASAEKSQKNAEASIKESDSILHPLGIHL